MCSIDASMDYKSFMDYKLIGVDKLNDSCTNNISTITKLIRIFKEFTVAQDAYSRVVLKTNIGLTQIAKTKSDCFHPILETISTTFSLFTNVQKTYSDNLNKAVKSLNVVLENIDENALRIFSARDINFVTNFKICQAQMEKSRQKCVALTSSSNDGSNTDDKLEKSSKRLKENYESAVEKYNTMRIQFLDIIHVGFNRSKQIQLNQLDAMRKFVRNIGNALAKLMFDLKESVDTVKQFYRSNNKEDIFNLWIDANKTVEDMSVDFFPKVVTELSESTPNQPMLINIDSSPPTSHNSATNVSDMKRKKIFQTRRTPNEPNIIDLDIPDLPSSDGDINNKKNSERTNVGALKTSKTKWPGFILKRFQSTNDLVDSSENKDSVDEDCWQSKSNLNQSVTVDEDGFIIRDTQTDINTRLSNSSSSDSSDGDRLRGIKVSIRPVTNSINHTASISEVVNAALQLPIPIREKNKFNEARRVSNLQRSTRPVSDVDKDRFSRRSLSVSELRINGNNAESPVSANEKSLQENVVIPIASAMTEVVSSEDGGYTCNIIGQMVLAWPLYMKDHLHSLSQNPVPDTITFVFLSDCYKFSSTQILKQYRDVARLDIIDPNKYTLTILRDLLTRIVADKSLLSTGNRISFPLLEYSMDIDKNTKTIIECNEQWTSINEQYTQFDFTLSSKYIDDNKPISVKISLISVGIIEDVSVIGALTPAMYNQKCWSIKYGKNDSSVSVKIRNDGSRAVKLRLSYEFVFETCSVAKPTLILTEPNVDENTAFKISLMHYRTIANDKFSQLFQFNIS